MKRAAWLTDIHLNFLSEAQVEHLFSDIATLQADAVLISGDIAESHDLLSYLARIERAIDAPLYFVLGNHDFYFGSIAEVRSKVAQFCVEHPKLHYLTALGTQELSKSTAVVGHDGWADGRLGNYERSMVSMYDFKLIAELTGLAKQDRWTVLKRLADEAAAHLRQTLESALPQFEHVLLVTHVPPLREACWHEGQISDDMWAPHFTSKAAGDVILAAAEKWPDRRITVLCGHTHGCGVARPMPNLEILTGAASYGEPHIERVLELS